MTKSMFGALFLLCLAALIAAIYHTWRTRVVAAWRSAAAKLDAHYADGTSTRPGAVTGTASGREFDLRTGVSYEDGPAYHHTAANIQCQNPAALVVGLRRRSVLENFNASRIPTAGLLADEEFNGAFVLVCNDPALLDELLDGDTRSALRRLEDVEVYVRDRGVSLRRSGERSSTAELVGMVTLAAKIAARLDALPTRLRSLSEIDADAALIEGGV